MAGSAAPLSPHLLPLYADVLRAWVADGRGAQLPLSGRSMWPTIDDGATVFVARCDGAAIRAGDVVVYENEARLICHRVLRRRRGLSGDALLTKGDALRVPAVWVAASAVVGRVVEIEAGGRRRQLDARSERVRALAAVMRSSAILLGGPLIRALRRATTAMRRA